MAKLAVNIIRDIAKGKQTKPIYTTEPEIRAAFLRAGYGPKSTDRWINYYFTTGYLVSIPDLDMIYCPDWGN